VEELKATEIHACISMLSKAETPSDALYAWMILRGRHPDLSGIIALPQYDKKVIPAPIKKYLTSAESYLVPYYTTDTLYFLSDDLLSKMFASGEQHFPIDYTIMFDTNIASYINKLVRLESVGSVQAKLIPLIDSLLYDELNFDHLFYMVENVKNVLPQIRGNFRNKFRFWKSLDKGFRQNLASLQIFTSIDCQEYKRSSRPKPRFTHLQAARAAAQFSYDFYVSGIGKDHILAFVLIQRLLLLQLIGMVKIQLRSDKSAKRKMEEYLTFVNDVVGAYFDREAIIAHKYFSNRKSLPILQKFQKGGSKTRLLKKLDNIAWDMAAPRFMEKLIGVAGGMDFFIPMFLTFVSGLKEMLSMPLSRVLIQGLTSSKMAANGKSPLFLAWRCARHGSPEKNRP
jgi:hypothetical protein